MAKPLRSINLMKKYGSVSVLWGGWVASQHLIIIRPCASFRGIYNFPLDLSKPADCFQRCQEIAIFQVINVLQVNNSSNTCWLTLRRVYRHPGSQPFTVLQNINSSKTCWLSLGDVIGQSISQIKNLQVNNIFAKVFHQLDLNIRFSYYTSTYLHSVVLIIFKAFQMIVQMITLYHHNFLWYQSVINLF